MREGTSHTERSRRKISRSLRGHRMSEETRERMRAARAKFLAKTKKRKKKEEEQ